MSIEAVPFIDLENQYRELKADIDAAITRVLQRRDFILGKDVADFEKAFAEYAGVPYAVGLNSGTDALFLSLLAAGIGPGDEVIVPAFTFIATAFVVTYTGARPVFVDIDPDTYNMDAGLFERAVTPKTKAVIPVHLFGQCADMDPILRVASKHGIAVIEDACQAHGARYKGKHCGSFGTAGCFSFYPTKNLGGMGDGGMVVTSDKKMYESLRKLRDCGRKTRYEHDAIGYNSRLDTLQAAVLSVKLRRLDIWNARRNECAALYGKLLGGVPGVQLPKTEAFSSHVWHVFAVQLPCRDRVADALRAGNIGVMINYPVPLHLQEAYAKLGHKPGDMPAAERVCGRVLSLPMHPFLTDEQMERVAGTVKKAVADE